MKTKHFYTDLYYDSAAPAIAGLRRSLSEATSSGVKDVVLCVSQLSSLSGTFSEAFGDDFAHELLRKGMYYYQGITFHLATKKKKAPRLSKCVVFGIETKPEEMKTLDQNENVVALVYMPLHQSELEAFVRRHPEAEHIKTE